MTATASRLLHRPGPLLAILNVGLGLALLLGDPLRTSAPSFMSAREIMPISFWGLAFLVGGLVCALAYRSRMYGPALIAAGAGVHAFWAVSLGTAAYYDNRAALTGVVVYSWTTLCHIVAGIRLAKR